MPNVLLTEVIAACPMSTQPIVNIACVPSLVLELTQKCYHCVGQLLKINDFLKVFLPQFLFLDCALPHLVGDGICDDFLQYEECEFDYSDCFVSTLDTTLATVQQGGILSCLQFLVIFP